ncbi:MAG TPA: hydrogenase maturation nickel metallochaperone HypA [Dissulfurispiraceae bacterium]|nr:hydrogenase maturation nickel metallochaperone HypA [Dissulfurispiraceae bacterium]
MSIAQSLLKIAVDECKGNGYTRINNVRVCIGNASGVMPEALLFAFNALKSDTIASGATLTIEEVPLAGRCSECSSDFTSHEKFVFSCPHCGGSAFILVAGRELDIKELEVD